MTTDEAFARTRELIALCAARTAGLQGAAAERYAGYVRNSLLLQSLPHANGTALPLDKGIRLAFIRLAGPWLLIPLLCAAVIAWIPSLWIQLLFSAVILLAFGTSWIPQFWSWRLQLRATPARMLPDAGARIEVTPERLTAGTISLPWSDVRLDAVELAYLWRPRIAPNYRVDQLRLATPAGPLLLDVRLIQNGRDVIDAICTKLG